MKIKLFSTGDIRDVSPDVGDMMVSAGLAVALTPKEANDHTIRSSRVPYHELNWSAREGDYVDGGYQYAPALVWRCQTCAQLTFNHPMEKPASDNVFHFEKQICPPEVYSAYVKLFEAWNKKGPRRLKGSYERALDAARQRTKSGLDDRNARPRDGEVVTL